MMCGLVGCLVGTLVCTSFTGRMNPRACVPNTKGSSHESLGTRFDSFSGSEENNRAPNTKGVADEHLFDIGSHGYQYSEEYNRLFYSKGACYKHRDTKIGAYTLSEEYYCLHILSQEIFLVMEYLKRIG